MKLAADALAELAEHWGENATPDTERFPQTWKQRAWSELGVVTVTGPSGSLVTEDSIAGYEAEWRQHNAGRPTGWGYATPYMDHLALLDLCCQPRLAEVLEEMIGEPAGVHLNLTGWRSTQRNWHTDQYLNEPYVGAHYAAVWIALDTIHPDAGPFEYVPGSHRWWDPISQRKIRAVLGDDGTGPDWPTHTERILTPLFDAELNARGVTPERFLGERGDVLVWHSRLLHRGSTPEDPDRERRALIAHFSGIHHRPDMPPAVQHEAGGWYFPLGGRQPVGLDR